MSLRVISGSAKGRRLKDVPGDTTRPVTDRVKESLFDILYRDVEDSAWWDLFGGTGAIGIEALSRGAAFVRFSDLNRLPVEVIKSNLQTCGLNAKAEVRRGDAFAMLAAAPERVRVHRSAAVQRPVARHTCIAGRPPGALAARCCGRRADRSARGSGRGTQPSRKVRRAQIW